MLKRKSSLKIINKVSTFKNLIKKLHNKKNRKPIILIPTMGALHQGHLSLIEKGKKIGGYTIVSIFINPIQFNNKNDLKNYPITLQDDINKLNGLKVDYLFIPKIEDIFGKNFQTTVTVNDLQKNLCGMHRPGHFNGVTTIVIKLFNIVKPDIAIFGKKDLQQLIIIKRMVKDLNLDIKIIEGKTIRERSGLALSSRNKLLTKTNYHKASKIYLGLKMTKNQFLSGKNKSIYLKNNLIKFFKSEGLSNIEYVQIVNQEKLEENAIVKKGDVIAVALKLGKIRLIDNLKL
tara:strand:+ start:24791 stop:25657 length:867 start_codon:yes stop_codon:yes gene_type:complete